ncbi:MAG: hypothetical protein KFB96_22445 [Thiocapsa sp.]|uniref:hypothetical protein n=1 Tax=Thiocapsa sp. TaxID=2024551 RepID=UPI001BCDF85B|nr:hypothetical protein [Thiocapsa sp.]QVL48340.1 MAG: hypothetical protein KFB96_22445 [Thiocapsa sp.]
MSKRFPFTWAAAGLGLVLALVLALGSGPGSGVDTQAARGMPLLTRLFIGEFGFLITVAGAFWGFKHRRSQGAEIATLIAAIACVVLAVAFLVMGIGLWTETFPSRPNP